MTSDSHIGGSKFYFSAHLTSTSILFAHFVFRYFPVHSIHSPRQSVLRRQKHSYFHHFIIRMVAPCEDTLMSETASARNPSQPLSSVLTHPQLGHSTRRSFAR